MNRFAAAPLALILLALGLAACGGEDAPSKGDFAADANEICKNAEEKLEDVGENASNPEEIADAVDKVIDETQKSVDELQDLELPDGDDGKAAEQFVNALETDIEDKGIPALEDAARRPREERPAGGPEGGAAASGDRDDGHGRPRAQARREGLRRVAPGQSRTHVSLAPPPGPSSPPSTLFRAPPC